MILLDAIDGRPNNADMVPLFVPLKTEWFDRFASGEKTVEWRLFGKRWNRETCIAGRAIILSKGYGKYARLHGTIERVAVVRRDAAPRAAQELFPVGDEFIAIHVHLHPQINAASDRSG